MSNNWFVDNMNPGGACTECTHTYTCSVDKQKAKDGFGN